MDSILTKIFVEVDYFMKDFEKNMKKCLITDGKIKRDRATKLSLSKVMTIVVFFHISRFRTFKDYYCQVQSKNIPKCRLNMNHLIHKKFSQ